jgi:hypothetical protein
MNESRILTEMVPPDEEIIADQAMIQITKKEMGKNEAQGFFDR